MNATLYTVGHSNHDIATFIKLLKQHEITAIGDVRSHPYSRYTPQFSQVALKARLTEANIAYVFLGKELGARSTNPACYRQGKVQYDRLAQEPSFEKGIERVLHGMKRFRIALMCSEKDPIDCHRAILVARKFFESGIPVSHIHAEGHSEDHQSMESRLLTTCKLPEGDMFTSREEFIADAYIIQGERVAFEDETMTQEEEAIAA